MPKLKQPPRQEVGDVRNHARAERVALRLRELSQMYRAEVPKHARSYQRWIQFLKANEALLAGPHDAASATERWKVSTLNAIEHFKAGVRQEK
jgi:hypothetical protein